MGYLDFVNTKMGTNSAMSFSRGNTLPLCQLPFGMCAFSPQTEIGSEPSWFYNPNKDYIEGIRLTHQPSPWIGDYGPLLFSLARDAYAKPQKSKIVNEELMPHYIKYTLDSSLCLEITPCERGGAFVASACDQPSAVFSIYSVFGNTSFELKGNYLHITNDYTDKSDAHNFTQHTVVSIKGAKIGKIDIKNGSCHISFKGKISGTIAISYISYEQALLELSRIKSFEDTLKNAEDVWENTLSKIELDSENQTQVGIFYSCMYRAFLFPHKAYEIDIDGMSIHYSPFKGTVLSGVRYTDYGFWDTYRTSIPLFCILARDELEKMLEGFLNDYYEGGYLPRWTSLGEVGCMPSTLIDGAIAEAVNCGVGSSKLHNELLKAMIHHANVPSSDPRYGREHLSKYLEYGYVPYTEGQESVNLSLDFAYGDWCIARVSELLGNSELAREYYARSLGWEKLFDKETGFVVARDELGNKRSDFDPFVWGYDYTESSAFQNIFGAPHALDRVAELLGGNDEAIKRLDEIFNTPPEFKHGRYGCEIHEMTEMANAPKGLGQCAISNQPSFSIPFLYSYYGNKKKSDYYVSKIASECFVPDSYPGDEDNGSMSAWYIFATLGKFPICPGSGKWVNTTPLAKYKIN